MSSHLSVFNSETIDAAAQDGIFRLGSMCVAASKWELNRYRALDLLRKSVLVWFWNAKRIPLGILSSGVGEPGIHIH